ncbi:MAG TPA: S-methyl-5-thioribose-1-phosphate isomerase [candidate division WOR-3 bacterium]|uniref:Methylthioribose-1-phosphate isomerase n=1 Tax=candidate division WOR-3 bacterium TaxID=2052148 RepID=A0A9C9EQ94_UNCW3|nr:S-methyl-5-thioribose-1-phosphate isomerase [candidate division WOR-3 bacterium]
MVDFKTIEYIKESNEIIILDQTKLPEQEIYIHLKTPEEVYGAIKNMQLRGAPLIGVAAAYGMVLAAYNRNADEVMKAAELLKSARPTAVNLKWAVERMEAKAAEDKDIYGILLEEAKAIEKEDRESCQAIGEAGAPLIKNSSKIMVHCNAGALATTGIGTALGILYTAKAQGKEFSVYSCETRPLLQGARLTSWELTRNGIVTNLICDNMAATYMAEMDLVLVGADRIAKNGDTANKIGTYGIAIIAGHFGVPFYVAAPTSTFDLEIESGEMIPIEKRCEEEIRFFNEKQIAASKARVCNPAFDVTPHSLLTGIITEKGIIEPPYEKNIERLLRTAQK